jgi:hypothetical protein
VLARSAAFLILLAFGGVGALAPQPPAAAPSAPPPASRALSPRNASYAITARLDPESRTLRGDLLLTWRNPAATPASTLQFHLYYNAWRNNRSTWMQERQRAGDRNGLATRPEADWGWIDVTNLRVIRGGAPVDATGRLRYISPDDGNPEDRTVAEVPLDAPVGPGETINVQIAWSSRVPRTFARTGVQGDFYFIAQWFPKIGVFEDAGWNCHQFHTATEFFADFGNYDVRLTVPSGWVVGATGLERGRREEGDGTTTHHYAQEDVHDFAWTTSPHYLERTATFEHATLPPVRMRLLLQPEHDGQADRHFAATRAALKYYGEWFGAYPYGHITVVDPAWQSGAGGMEYPTLFTAGSSWLAPRGVAEPEGVTVHEAGHQFWYGIVANNEFEHAWMDEGFNTFTTARVIAEAFEPNFAAKRYFGGFIPWTFRDLPISRPVAEGLGWYRPAANGDVPAWPTWRYWPGTAGTITYSKTALWLHTLERMVGWDTLQRIMSVYFTRWAFKHPQPADFFAVVNEVSGQDLTWFFDQVYRSPATFDYGIDQLTSEPPVDRGVFGEGTGRAFKSGEPAATPDRYRTTVVVRRHGNGTFPVDVRVVFENNQETRWRWDGRDRWKAFEVEHPSRAKYAQVDPDRVLLLDLSVTNNSMAVDPASRRAARKWSLVWLIWLQDHLLTYGFFI